MFPSSADIEPAPGSVIDTNHHRANPDLVAGDLVGFRDVNDQRLFGHTDLQTNEVNLNDLNRRVDLKSELIDDGGAEVVVDQLVTDSDLHASRFGGEDDDDDIGASQQAQI